MINALTYDDINIIPKYSEIESRSNVSLKTSITTNYSIDIPIIATPMDTVVGLEMMFEMWKNGGIAFLPRFNSIDSQVDVVTKLKFLMQDYNKNNDNPRDIIIGVSIGVKRDDVNNAEKLINAGANIILIDIAHGHCLMMKNTLEQLVSLRNNNDAYVFDIIAGNVATGDATLDLIKWGADGIRCGIGGGCFTSEMVVSTETGLKKIKDIEMSDKVYTHRGVLNDVVGKVSYFTSEDIYIINDSIKCTSKHKFYVIRKKYEDIVNNNNIQEYAEWISAESLNYEYMLIKLINYNTFKLKEIENITTEPFEGMVYDLMVNEDETYNINNIIVHNSRCSTRIETGVGVPMITSILDCVEVADRYNIPVIADGGLSKTGDITKALACGANSVMLGNMLAGTNETPPDIQVDNNGLFVKEYSGSASMSNKTSRGEKVKHIEGVSKNVIYKGPLKLVIDKIIDGISSSFSYVGANNINEFQHNVEFCKVTSNGVLEAHPHH